MFYVCQISISIASVDDAIWWAESSPLWLRFMCSWCLQLSHNRFFCITNIYIVDISWFIMLPFQASQLSAGMFFSKSRCRDGCTTYVCWSKTYCTSHIIIAYQLYHVHSISLLWPWKRSLFELEHLKSETEKTRKLYICCFPAFFDFCSSRTLNQLYIRVARSLNFMSHTPRGSPHSHWHSRNMQNIFIISWTFLGAILICWGWLFSFVSRSSRAKLIRCWKHRMWLLCVWLPSSWWVLI